MKKLILTLVAVAGLSVSVFGQAAVNGTITIDNVNGGGGVNATNLGLFFSSTAPNAAPYNGDLNLIVRGGADPGSLSPVGPSFTGANKMVGFGGGIYVEPLGGIYQVPNVALGGNASLQVLAWRGNAASYAAAGVADKFFAYNGQTGTFVDASTFTFINRTGGDGVPPAVPKSLDGMPAMALVVPEPSMIALAGLGGVALLMYRRRKA